MKSISARPFRATLLAITCLAAIPAVAEDEVDPPARAARLSYIRGEVSFAPEGDNTWVEANINRPLTTGDQLWTADNARAELQLGSATIQANEHTSLSFLELTDVVAQLRLTEGTVNVRIRHLQDDEVIEIDTPNSAVSLLEPGVYRIDVDAAGSATAVRVRDGRAEVNGDRQSFTLDGGEQATFTGFGRLTAEFSDIDAEDEFDRWAAARNDRAERAAASRYVADGVIGYEDLDDYGYWRSDAEFGFVWIPTTVAVGWAPYRYGHWAWIAPWGWTWVDDAPWGFAPFHYGRWAYRANRWCWVPGPRHVRPIYAPALVAWIGGPGVNLSISIGPNTVGWLPLGPREVYIPGYRSSRGYLRNVNIANAHLPGPSYVDNVFDRGAPNIRYVNRDAPGAFSLVEQRTFVKGRPVSNHMVRVNARVLQEMPMQPRPPELKPERDSLFGPGRRIAPPPRAAVSRSVVAVREPRFPSQRSAPWESASGRSGADAKPPVNIVRPSRPSFRESAVPGRPVEANGPGMNKRTRERDEQTLQRGFPAPGGSPPEIRSEARSKLPAPSQSGSGWRNRTEREAPRALPEATPDASRQLRERSPTSSWIQRENRLQQGPRSTVQGAPERRPSVQAPARAAPDQAPAERRKSDRDEERR